jgi:hypothetical protein
LFLFNIHNEHKKQKKTAYHTHFFTSKALQQPLDDHVVVSPSRGSTFIKKRIHRDVTTPSDKTSSTIESEHLPPIRHSQVASEFRQHSTNDFNSRRAVQILLKYNKSSARPSKNYIKKTMSTATTVKKPVPIGTNGILSKSVRSYSSDSNKRV